MTEARIQSQIHAVTVYREGARVRRICEMAAEDGAYPSMVYVTGLPLALQDGSVRVSVEPADQDGAAVPVAADVRVSLDVPDSDDSLAPPEDAELAAARKAVRVLSGRISQLKRELSRMDRLVIVPRPGGAVEQEEQKPPPESPLAARLALLELRKERERTLRKELSGVEKELKDAEKRAKKLEARHHRATTARQAREHELRKALVIALHPGGDGPMAGRVRLFIDYLVPGARWAPAYTIRLTPGDGARFSMRALVAQQTGEDWRGVALTLSTADAQGFVELPELSSLRIGRRQVRPARLGWRPPPSGSDELFADHDRDFAGRGQAAPSGESLSHWDDETREITVPARRPAPAAPHSAIDSLDFEEVTGQYDTPRMESSSDEEDTLPPMPPRELMRSATFSAPPAPAMQAQAPGGMPRSGAAPQKKRARKRMVAGLSWDATLSKSSLAGMGGALFADAAAPEALDERGGGYGADHDHEELAVTASSELLAYADLRMAPAGASRRGTLQLARRTDMYMELLQSRRIEVSFNALAVISIATRRAESVAPLPPRYRIAGSDRYDYAYQSENPIDVPSDGAYHSIALVARDADVKIHHVVVPRESTDVFRVADVQNPLGAPILDGPVDVYLNKDFLLTGDVEFTPPGGVMSLGLGVDQAVKVARNTAYREEASGLMRGSLLLKHEIRIDVQNHRDRPIDCEVRERIPATRKDEDDIEVILDKVSPRWESYDPDLASSPEAGLRGGYRWRIQVEARGSAALAVDYSIKIPAKYELAGGNRREF